MCYVKILEEEFCNLKDQRGCYEVAHGDNYKDYYKNNHLHRLDGPAITRSYGYKYYKEGKLHRIDGPAIVYVDGSEYFFKDNKLHRLDGPAVIHADGTKYYYQNNKLHRLDGPAAIKENGSKEYYLNDKKLSKKGFIKELSCKQLEGFLLNPENF